MWEIEPDVRWSSSGVKPRESGSERAGSAGRSPQCSLSGETWTVERRRQFGRPGTSSARAGTGTIRRTGRPWLGKRRMKARFEQTQIEQRRGAAGACTQGWLQPACACAGKTAFTAASTSHATADEPIQRQRRTRVIAMARPNDREIVEIRCTGQTGRDRSAAGLWLRLARNTIKSSRMMSKSQV